MLESSYHISTISWASSLVLFTQYLSVMCMRASHGRDYYSSYSVDENPNANLVLLAPRPLLLPTHLSNHCDSAIHSALCMKRTLPWEIFWACPHHSACRTSLTRDENGSPCRESAESSPLDHQQSPSFIFKLSMNKTLQSNMNQHFIKVQLMF